MSLWGLAAAGAVPHKAWLMLWFLVSRASMPRAGARDLSLWVYSLALLKVTPSPVWCSSYVEASYGPLTRHDARPQVSATTPVVPAKSSQLLPSAQTVVV